MPLMSCPECQGQVSTSARACPHCGYKRPRHLLNSFWIWAGRGLLLAAGLYLAVWGIAEAAMWSVAVLMFAAFGASFKWPIVAIAGPLTTAGFLVFVTATL